jgi:hypothetical protein
MNRVFCLASLLVFTLCCFSLYALGQQSLGSITGTVTDTTGAVVPDVHVQLLNKGTALQKTTITNRSGIYNFPDLPIGLYSFTFTREGFKTEVHSEVLVQANRTTTLAPTLQAGASNTTIEVVATPLLNQVDTTNGYILGADRIQEVPLATGSFTQLAILSPGVNADLLAGAGTGQGLGNQAIWANGQRDTSNSFTFNAVNANNVFNGKSTSYVGSNRYVLSTGENFLAGGQIQTNTSVYDAIGQGLPTPPQETIQELRVNTSMYDASQGANSGAHVDVITKSGTNQFHGQLYGYRQTDDLNAAPFFFKQDPSIPPSQKVPSLHRGVFGGTLGGPIIRNKMFFFGSYQGVRTHDQYNGFSPVTVPLHLTDDRSPGALAQVAQQDFGAAVNPTQMDPAAIKLLQAKLPNGQFLIPTPTITDPTLATTLGHDAVLQAPPSTFTADQVNANIDYDFSARDILAAKYYFQRDPTTSPFAISQVLGFPQKMDVGSQVFSLDNISTLRPTITWEQKIGFIRQRAFSTTEQAFTPAQMGINLFGSTRFPGISINTADATIASGLFIGPSSPFSNAGVFQNQYEVSTNLNWIAGRHTLSFGTSVDYNQLNVINQETQVAQVTATDFPSFLTGTLKLGEENSVFFEGAANRYYRSKQVGAYAQDKIRLGSQLVLDVGLRFDWDGPLAEKYGHLVNFDRSKYQYDAATDTIVNDGLIVAGNNSQFHTPGASNSTLTGHQYGFAPRIGVAWSPSFIKNFVVRTGFGMYYDRGEFFSEFSPGAGFGFNGPFGVTLQPPFVLPVLSTGSDSLSNPFGLTKPVVQTGNPATFSALLPNISQLLSGNFPPGNAFGPFLFGGYDPRNQLPYSENWTLDLQWQPRPTIVTTLAYVGNRGLHEVLPIPFNQPLIATPQHPINGQIYSYGYNVTSTETAFTVDGGNTDVRVPFIGYSPNSVFYEAEGISTYHAVQAGLTKRMSHGFQFSTSYTYSHSLDEGSGLGLFYNGNNPLTPREAYSSSDFDRTHVLAVNYYYELPKFVHGGGVGDKVLNGWGVTGIGMFESGQPYNVYDFSGAVASIFYSTNDFITNPIVGLAPGFTPSRAVTGASGAFGNPALNPAAFTIPLLAPGQKGVPPCDPNGVCDTFETDFANGSRNIFRGAFQKRMDLSIFKQTKLSERFNLKYSFDIFNLTNTASFDTPNNNVAFNPFFANPPFNPTTGQNGYQIPPSGSLGIVQHTLGSPRFIQMSLHLTF